MILKYTKEIIRGLGYLLFVIGIIMIIYSYIFHNNIEKFKASGVRTEGTVVRKWENKGRRTSTFYVRVSYLVGGSILEGGKLTFSDVETNYTVWKDISASDRIEILYLPTVPEEAILTATIKEENFTIAERKEPGYIIFGLGACIVFIDQILRRSPKKTANLTPEKKI
jgi:hypothetical protein